MKTCMLSSTDTLICVFQYCLSMHACQPADNFHPFRSTVNFNRGFDGRAAGCLNIPHLMVSPHALVRNKLVSFSDSSAGPADGDGG